MVALQQSVRRHGLRSSGLDCSSGYGRELRRAGGRLRSLRSPASDRRAPARLRFRPSAST
eukprot:1111123-Alexandrium_andersonii.AAC.1